MVRIEKYTEKSIVVRDVPDRFMTNIASMGGKLNNRLTNKETGEVFTGWIFPATRKDEVQNWINNVLKGTIPEVSSTPKQAPVNLSENSDKRYYDLLSKFAELEKRVKLLESKQKPQLQAQIIDFPEQDDDDDEETSTRFLRK